MSAAQRYVALIPADFDLRALALRGPVALDTYHHRGLASAVADRLDLDEVVRPPEELRAARKELATEIGAQSIAEHRDVELVDHRPELPHLLAGQELRFVDQHAGERRAHVLGADPFEQVGPWMEVQALAFDAGARMDAPAVTRIDLRREQQRAHAALFVV